MWLYWSYLMFILWIMYWTSTKQRLRCGFTAADFGLYCAYYIETVRSRHSYVVILKVSPCLIVHNLWTGAKQRLRSGYIAASFCLYCAYSIEMLQRKDWALVILQVSTVCIEYILLNLCKTETEMRLYRSYFLFILFTLYWIGAKKRLRFGYTAANSC